MTQTKRNESENLFAILAEQGRSLTWLASRMHYTREYISLVKSGKRPVTDEFMRRAAAVLGLPTQVLFLRDEVRESTINELSRTVA
jgi:transcriptional regulator with XRE-family HTH domain